MTRMQSGHQSLHGLLVVNVLVVDNLPDNLLSMEAILSAPGLRLVSARSGREALKAVLEYDFAVILLDVQMPDMDGFETAEIIRQRERSQSTPIIFVSAISKDSQHVFRGYALGAVDYVFKPFMPEVLRSKVEVFVEIQRKRLELQRQMERMESVNQDVDILSMTLKKMLRLVPSGLPANLQRDRLVELLDEFTRASDAELSPVRLSLSQICGQAVEAAVRNGKPRVRWSVSSLPEVEADEWSLRVVFRRLLDLGMLLGEASPDPAPEIEVGAWTEPSGECVVFVKASGHCLDAGGGRDLAGALKTLQQHENFELIGLSAAVVRRVLDKNGGRLWTHADPDKGTELLFSLPASAVFERGLPLETAKA